jgi:hypothetical protein
VLQNRTECNTKVKQDDSVSCAEEEMNTVSLACMLLELVIPATWEAEIRRITVLGQPGQKV